MQRFAAIRGRVVRDDGTPLAGVRVHAEPEAGDAAGPSAVPTRSAMFPPVEPQTTAADGSFALTVHPGTTWTLITRLDPRRPRLGTIATGSAGVTLRVTADDLAGVVVQVTVLADADGAPIGDARFQLQTWDGSGRWLHTASIGAEAEGHRYVLEALPCGRQFALMVACDEFNGFMGGPLAPRRIGPFTTTGGRMELTARLQAWGDLPVRVTATDGRPRHDLSVNTESDLLLGVFLPPIHVDAEGRALLQHRDPGRHRLRVTAGHQRVLLEQDVVILPGRNPELELRLPGEPEARRALRR